MLTLFLWLIFLLSANHQPNRLIRFSGFSVACQPWQYLLCKYLSQTHLRLKGVNPPDMTRHIFTPLLYARFIKKSIKITSNILQSLVIFFSCKLAYPPLQQATGAKPVCQNKNNYLPIMVHN